MSKNVPDSIKDDDLIGRAIFSNENKKHPVSSEPAYQTTKPAHCKKHIPRENKGFNGEFFMLNWT